MKVKKRKKSSRYKGSGTAGGGARKKRKKSGHKGGVGMSGSGKRSDHKKTLITKLYGHGYFGKQGVTSRKTKKDKRKRINIGNIESNLESYINSGLAKKTGKKFEINLEGYKILGDGEAKNKLIIKANDSSESARRKVEEKGGKIILLKKGKQINADKTGENVK